MSIFPASCFERVLELRSCAIQGNPMSDSRSIRIFSLNHQWLVRLAVVALLGVTVTQTGCTVLRSLDQAAAITYRDLVWSKRAYNLRYGNCDRPYSEHFRNGFCDGYSDVCQGGDGYTPALPPDDYRGYEFQSADGSNCVDAWFEGYPAGVAAARKDNSGSFHDLAVSRLIESAIKQENNKPKLTGKVPVVSGKKVVGENIPVQLKAPPVPNRPTISATSDGIPSVLSTDPNIQWNAEPLVVPAGFTPSSSSFELNGRVPIRPSAN